MLLGFLIGLSVGTALLINDRRRYDAKLKRLLLRLEDHQPLSALGYDAQLASAIGEQRSQIEALNLQLKEFRELLQKSPVGYLQVDEENRLLWCNQRAQEFLDIEQGDYEEPRLLLAIVRSYELDQLVEKTRQAQSVCEARWTFNSISTDPYNYLERPAYPLHGYGLPLSNGQVGVFLENKQEAVLLEQQRDRWISDVAHELKTPLTSIRLVAETLQSRVEPKLVSWVERLLKEVIRLSKLVDDVLNISSLEQQQQQLADESEIDFVPLIQAAWQGVEPLAKLKQVTLNYQGEKTLMVRINVSLMHAVLFNLLSNAVKYSPADQSIRVRLSVTETFGAVRSPKNRRLADWETSELYILLEVVDAGSGLDEKDLPHVFDRFYRGDPSRSRFGESEVGSGAAGAVASSTSDGNRSNAVELAELSSSGTGLGLAIVRQIVTAHEGWVDAKNDPETGGGWLRVWLPAKRLVGEVTAT
ncbi:MAG: PAS domain-containing sensor histidine kinase [Cyanobacteria bacterium J06632_3]